MKKSYIYICALFLFATCSEGNVDKEKSLLDSASVASFEIKQPQKAQIYPIIQESKQEYEYDYDTSQLFGELLQYDSLWREIFKDENNNFYLMQYCEDACDGAFNIFNRNDSLVLSFGASCGPSFYYITTIEKTETVNNVFGKELYTEKDSIENIVHYKLEYYDDNPILKEGEGQYLKYFYPESHEKFYRIVYEDCSEYNQ